VEHQTIANGEDSVNKNIYSLSQWHCTWSLSN